MPLCRGAACLLLVLTLVPASGCLSLGGRTTYVHEKPETLGRITALETRVHALEQALATPVVSESYSSP